MKKIKFILLLPILFLAQLMAENSLAYINANISGSLDGNITTKPKSLKAMDLNKSLSSEENLSSVDMQSTTILTKNVVDFPRKSLLEVEAEARAIIAEEVAKVEIVKANALAVIARAVASVEIAKIREEQEKQSQSDLF